MQIATGKVAVIDYVLKDGSGTELDRSDNSEFSYLHGAQNIIQGLEDALEGKQAGDVFEVCVEPGLAYGARDPDRVQTVPRDLFENDADIKVGTRFHAESPDGEMIIITVIAVDGEEVTIDGNHEFAGMDLYFEVSVCAVRDATEAEISHGHVHEGGRCGTH